MGKLASAAFDGMLGAKMKSLVSGAIERSRLEKPECEPSLSYEVFVQRLNTGDSFATSIIDILVNELAERASRPDHKELIAERTARNLRRLASPAQIYRSSSFPRPRRRSVHLTDYLHVPPSQLDVEDDSDGVEWLDATRFVVPDPDSEHTSSSQIYESLTPWINPNTSTSPAAESPPEPSREASRSPRILPLSAVPRSLSHGSWLGSFPSARRTFRRSSRGRAQDFSEFTSRRRSTAREGAQPTQATGGDVDSSMEHLGFSAERDFTLSGARRFFQMSGRPPHQVLEQPVEFPYPLGSTSRADLGQSPSPPPPLPASPAVQPLTSHPSLRRGGIRAPEVLIRTRHLSSPPPETSVDLPQVAAPPDLPVLATDTE